MYFTLIVIWYPYIFPFSSGRGKTINIQCYWLHTLSLANDKMLRFGFFVLQLKSTEAKWFKFYKQLKDYWGFLSVYIVQH